VENFERLQLIRQHLLHELGISVTVGFAPQFLHSTGQLHKGGKNLGRFIQLIYIPDDLSIPELNFSFSQVLLAEATGDMIALKERDRFVRSIYLRGDLEANLKNFQQQIMNICHQLKLGR
jgi:hypothetical protein